MPLSHHIEIFHRVGGFKHAGNAVVIGSGNRVEFVIMTPGASEGHAHKRTADRVDLFIHDVHFHLPAIVTGEHLGADRKKPGGHQAAVFLL